MVEKSDIGVEVCRFSRRKALWRLLSRVVGALEAVNPVVVEIAVGKPPSLRRRKASSTEERESRRSAVEGGEGESTLPTRWTEVVDGPASGRLRVRVGGMKAGGG